MSNSADQKLVTWVKQYGPRLRHYLMPRINRADAEDLIQEIFIHLQLRRQNTTIENPRSYIFTVARNLLINRYRTQKARANVFPDSFGQELEVPDLISPERTAIGKQEYGRALQAIVDLPPRARTAFQLHRFGGMTYQDIAEHMNISKESVKELIQRSLVRIRKAMKD